VLNVGSLLFSCCLHLAAEESTDGSTAASHCMCDDSAVRDCSVSSFANGTVETVGRPSRLGDGCSSKEHGCTSASVVSNDLTHTDSDCKSASADVCSAQQRGALPSSSCQVFHTR